MSNETSPASAPIPVLGPSPEGAAAPAWSIDARTLAGPSIEVAYVPRAPDMWRRCRYALRTFLAVLVPIYILFVLWLLTRFWISGSTSQYILVSIASALGILTILLVVFLGVMFPLMVVAMPIDWSRSAAQRGVGRVTMQVTADTAGAAQAFPGTSAPVPMSWRSIRGARILHSGDVLVERRFLFIDSSVFIPRSAFTDTDSAERFCEAIRLLRVGRGSEIPKATLREFAPGKKE